jgi:hypothetical protein
MIKRVSASFLAAPTTLPYVLQKRYTHEYKSERPAAEGKPRFRCPRGISFIWPLLKYGLQLKVSATLRLRNQGELPASVTNPILSIMQSRFWPPAV